MTEKRFIVVYNEQCKMVQYVDNQKEEPNRWAIGNASETAQKLNELHEEKELEHKRVNYLKKIVAENCPNSLLIQVQNDLEEIE